jgi:hypothetical protein
MFLSSCISGTLVVDLTAGTRKEGRKSDWELIVIVVSCVFFLSLGGITGAGPAQDTQSSLYSS